MSIGYHALYLIDKVYIIKGACVPGHNAGFQSTAGKSVLPSERRFNFVRSKNQIAKLDNMRARISPYSRDTKHAQSKKKKEKEKKKALGSDPMMQPRHEPKNAIQNPHDPSVEFRDIMQLVFVIP